MAGDARAMLGLDDAIDSLTEPGPDALGGMVPGTTPDDADVQAAVKAYAAGRLMLLAGDARGAIERFDHVIEIDPTAADAWRGRGEAALALGQVADAMRSYRNAVRRGDRRAGTLAMLGRWDADRLDHESAARLLALALRADDAEASDPALPILIRVDLGVQLLETGFISAGIDALQSGLDLPERWAARTRYQAQVGRVYQQASARWEDVGDAQCLLGRFQAGLDAYRRAARLPLSDPASNVPRRTFALLSLSRPARAGLDLIDGLIARGGLADDATIRQIARVAQRDQRVAEAMARAIRDLGSSMPAPPSPSVEEALARALAATMSPDQRRAELIRRAGDLPQWAGLIGDLIDPLADAPDRLSAAWELVASHPLDAQRVVDRLVAANSNTDAMLESLAQRPEGSTRRIIRAWLLARADRIDEALALLDGPEERLAEGELLARARIAGAEGRWDRIESAIAALRPRTSVAGQVALSRSLESAQRYREALNILNRLVGTIANEADRRRVDLLVEAANLAMQVGDPSGAEQFLLRLFRVDPGNENAAGGLLALYDSSGPLANASRFQQLVGELRRINPAGRSLRLLQARELVRRGQMLQAERFLTTQTASNPLDQQAIESLTGLWVAAASATEKRSVTRGLAWLDSTPESLRLATPMVLARARLLTANGAPRDAERLLVERSRVDPSVELRVLREQIVREALSEPDRADDLAIARLDRPHRSIDQTLDLAQILIGRNRSDDALHAIEDGVPESATLSSRQSRGVDILSAALLNRARADGSGPALNLISWAIGRGVVLPVQIHMGRIQLLAGEPGASIEDLLAASRAMLDQHADLGDQAFVPAARALAGSNQAKRALEYLARAADLAPAPATNVFRTWFDLIGLAGGIADAQKLLERAEALDALDALLAALPGQQDPAPTSPIGAKAEVLYRLGNLASVVGRKDVMEALYRRCLSIQPDHPWAANNLGYELVEAGRSLREAERLILIAYRHLPDESSVVDSLGWVRYKAGRIADEPAQDGQEGSPGAVTLLERAATLGQDPGSATILDHLGDALWRADRHDEAVAHWQAARDLLQKDLEQLAQRKAPESAISPVRAQAQRAQTKIEAARQGRDPPIAPLAEPAHLETHPETDPETDPPDER